MRIDPKILAAVRRKTLPYNEVIANGISGHLFENLEAHLDQIIRSIAISFPPSLKFIGLEPMLPDKEVNTVAFVEEVRRRSNRRRVDIARSNVKLVSLMFEIFGKPYSRAIYLPFKDHDGRIPLSGTYYWLVPVMSDKDICVTAKDVFIRFIRGKLTVMKQSYIFYIDGVSTTVGVVWSKVHNYNAKASKIKPKVNAHTTLMHYLLMKYGFNQTFEMFTGVIPIVGSVSSIRNKIDPKVDYMWFSSLGNPSGSKNRAFHTPTTLNIAVPRHLVTDEIKSMIAGVFYVADFFPTYLNPDEIGEPNEIYTWKILMGYIIWGDHLGSGKIIDECDRHLKSLGEYIDPYVYERFVKLGYNCRDLYELFFMMIRNYETWVLDAQDTITSMYEKEVNILYYVLEPIIRALVKCSFQLSSPNRQRGELSGPQIEDTINKMITRGLIYQIVRLPILESVSYSGDNKAYKFSSALLSQAGASTKARKRLHESDPALQADASLLTVAEANGIGGSDPTGRERLNLYCHLDAANVTKPPPHLKDLIERIQNSIRRT